MLGMAVQSSPLALAGEKGIPTDELEVAADIYVSLQLFFSEHTELQERPLFITGESYAGKYVPAIGGRIACPRHPRLSSRPLCSSAVTGPLAPATTTLAGKMPLEESI